MIYVAIVQYIDILNGFFFYEIVMKTSVYKIQPKIRKRIYKDHVFVNNNNDNIIMLAIA